MTVTFSKNQNERVKIRETVVAKSDDDDDFVDIDSVVLEGVPTRNNNNHISGESEVCV